MDQHAPSCPKCHSEAVEDEPIDGLVICTACGFVLDDIALDDRREGDGMEWNAAHQLGVREVAGAFSCSRNTITGKQMFSQEMRNYRILKELERFEDMLQLPARAREQAAALLQMVLELPLGFRYGISTSCVVIILLAARQNDFPLLMKDVAAAAEVSLSRLARCRKFLQENLQIEIPMLPLKLVLMRYGLPFIQEVVPAEDISLPQQHPVMKRALELLDFVEFTNCRQGYAPTTVVAAITKLALQAHSKSLHLDTARLASCFALNEAVISRYCAFLTDKLMSMAKFLPMSSIIHAKNVVMFVATINCFCRSVSDADDAVVQQVQRSPPSKLRCRDRIHKQNKQHYSKASYHGRLTLQQPVSPPAPSRSNA